MLDELEDDELIEIEEEDEPDPWDINGDADGDGIPNSIDATPGDMTNPAFPSTGP